MAKPESKPNKNLRSGEQKVAANVVNQSTRNLKQMSNSAGREKRAKSGGTIAGTPKY